MGFYGVGKTVRKLFPILALLLCSPCWAAFRSAGTAITPSKTATSTTVPSPAGFAADDILLIVVSIDGTGVSITWPSGFAQLYASTLTMDGQQVFLAWKRAVGGDSLALSRSGTAGQSSWVAQCFAWSGRDTTNPPVGSTAATNSSSNASPTTLTANGVTAVAGDDLVWIGGLDANAGTLSSTFTSPSGYTSQGVTIDTADQFDVFAVATSDAVSAGATGTVSGTLTHSGTAGWAAYLIRIPAAGGGGGGSPAGFNKRQKLCKLDETLC